MWQYKKEGLKFCKLQKNSKKPFERDWVNIPYSFNEIEKWINQNNNFGVLCGYGGLIVIDSDDKKLQELIDKKLPKTLKIQTGRGGTHNYYICNSIKRKIILQSGSEHLGEIQSFGTQVVGANSIHPNGKKYIIINDMPIIEISFDNLIYVLRPYIKNIENSEKKIKEEIKSYGDADINNIQITTILDISVFKKAANGELFGKNPWHGSETGMNFWINPNKNISYCFRCSEGLSIVKIIALENRIINSCSDYLTRENFLSVLDIAHEKYGLQRKKNLIREASQKSFDDVLLRAKQFIKIQPIYYDEAKLWWMWDFKNYFWRKTNEVNILNEIIKHLNADIVTQSNRTKILNSLKQVGRMQSPMKTKDTWIQFVDKIVDIKDENSFAATYKYFVVNPIPWKLGNSIDTPTIDKIFKEWVGEDYYKTLYEIIAYCLLPVYPIHRLFCFIGEGLNGKSKFLELITKFIGRHNICSTELDTLLNSRFEMVKLYKKLVCQMGETNFNEINKTSMLKKLTGQDLIGFEFKNKDLFDDYNYAKILISTNSLPTTSDKTVGFYRRWLIIDFPNKFNEDKDILDDIPREEYNNLALKSVKILKELLQIRKFSNEGSIEDRTTKFEEKSNPFDKFISEMVEEEPSSYIFKWEFRKELDNWCKTNRFRILSDRFIAGRMKYLNVTTQKILVTQENKEGVNPQYRAWVGIKWKTLVGDKI